MSVILGGAIALLVLMLPFFERPAIDRVQALRPRSDKTGTEPTGPMTAFGRLFYNLLTRWVPAARALNLTDDALAKIAMGVSIVALLALFKPSLAVALAVGLVAYPPLKIRSDRMRRVTLIERQLPMVTDLFRIAINAGMNVSMALRAVSIRVADPMGAELRLTVAQLAKGRRTSDALADLVVRTSEAMRPLASALASAERYGSPLSVVLERLAHDARIDQERRAEKITKRLSISLLFPVAGCTLPAFVLLTVAPLFASAVSPLASLFS